jgi:tetratricopeptide (TPR) repeat protein
MPVRFGLFLALFFGVLLASLAAINPTRVSFALGQNLATELPLVALVMGAFLAGACLVLCFMLLRDLGRSFREYKLARRARRAETPADLADFRLGEIAESEENRRAAPAPPLQAVGSEERADRLLALVETYQRGGRVEDALATYRQIAQRAKDHATALRAIRTLSASTGRWADALDVQERLSALAGAQERPAEIEWLAGIHYEIGKARLAEGEFAEARRHFTEALSVDRTFLPAHLALGEAWEQTGDRREAIRTWKRAAEIVSAPVLLHRLEQAYRSEGRPSLMIALYREALDRAPQDLALAFALGRVYFELEMLDEAADQFQKVEVRAPDVAPVHAFLGAVYERRGQTGEAFEEYRKALRLAQGFDWPHRCAACGAAHGHWQGRCSLCGRWNTSTAS